MLRYGSLQAFDEAMISLLKKEHLLSKQAYSLWTGQQEKTLIYGKGNVVFAFNFHPTQSFDGYFIPVQEEGTYAVILSTDDEQFGGPNRIDTDYRYQTIKINGQTGFKCYLPSRSALVLKKVSRKRKTS